MPTSPNSTACPTTTRVSSSRWTPWTCPGTASATSTSATSSKKSDSRAPPLRPLRHTLCVPCVFLLHSTCAESFSNHWKTRPSLPSHRIVQNPRGLAVPPPFRPPPTSLAQFVRPQGAPHLVTRHLSAIRHRTSAGEGTRRRRRAGRSSSIPVPGRGKGKTGSRASRDGRRRRSAGISSGGFPRP